MSDAANESKLPPRASYESVIDLLGEIKANKVVPPVITRELMPRMSGTGVSEALAALRFLGLIEDGGKVQPELRKLIAAHGTSEWPTLLKPLVEAAYAPVLKVVHIESDTQSALRKALKDMGIAEGDALDRALRFFVKAAKDSGFSVSPYFKLRRPRGTGKKAMAAAAAARDGNPPAGAPAADGGATGERPNNPPPPLPPLGAARPTGMKAWPLTGTHEMWLPIDLNDADLKMLDAYGPLLKAFAAGNK